MKNTFAAHRHLPTGAIHILDLALFQKQTMPDGATSLACKYIAWDQAPSSPIGDGPSERLAIIASGEQDEPGITYTALSEKENAEIMEAYVFCEWPQATHGKYENLPNNSGYLFRVDPGLPEHIIATVEFIEPEEIINPAVNNCASPLKLTWNVREPQYKVNKPLDQSGEYVDKSIADALLAALVDLKERCLVDDPEFNLPSVNAAIEIATSGLPIIKPSKP